MSRSVLPKSEQVTEHTVMRSHPQLPGNRAADVGCGKTALSHLLAHGCPARSIQQTVGCNTFVKVLASTKLVLRNITVHHLYSSTLAGTRQS